MVGILFWRKQKWVPEIIYLISQEKEVVERNNEHHLKRSKDEISDYHNMVVKIYS